MVEDTFFLYYPPTGIHLNIRLAVVCLICCVLQVCALMVENTFTSVEDMVSRIVPPLGLVVGTGKPLNFLVTNKWHNTQQIKRITTVPMLMLISGLVRAQGIGDGGGRLCIRGQRGLLRAGRLHLARYA